ncbi:hypothetical protein TNIN_101391 [Trichonephila inaurata madagascariensis]|uniref:TsaA-like domain-containing protein n=1 Tax=Trichonephila inaurata madagascariensis TaxID=2747483 RepID=A0A8X6KA21_9ARAC|nr:hypothetical protein TNIN_101391 [Trichonephila inaurata madagascariensis]
MIELEKFASEIHLARRELKNIRQECLKQKANLQIEVSRIKDFLSNGVSGNKETCHSKKNDVDLMHSLVPIGFISSCFKSKNGIPRQPSLCPKAKGTLSIEKNIFTNPEHSLIGLEEFSHVWIIFIFHKNGHNSVRAKVHPPRLNGSSVGVFSTRSPHRPCAIGLSLTKLDKIEGNTLFLSGLDLLDGTPVLDIKPYIPLYDIPTIPKETSTKLENVGQDDIQTNALENQSPEDLCCENTKKEITFSSDINVLSNESDTSSIKCNVASYLTKSPEYLNVLFTERASRDIENFHRKGSHKDHCIHCFTFTNPSEAKQAITDVLKNDPRSVYRRKKCSDRLYYFYMNNLHITCWFDHDIAEVLRIKPSSMTENTCDNEVQ